MGDLLRSSRLVVDTGIHKYGWTKESAAKFISDNTAFSAEAANAEVDRYISLPGQAVSYKVGEREIQRLRKKFTESSNFDLKKFHTAILNCEGPLATLESCVKNHLSGSASNENNSTHNFHPQQAFIPSHLYPTFVSPAHFNPNPYPPGQISFHPFHPHHFTNHIW